MPAKPCPTCKSDRCGNHAACFRKGEAEGRRKEEHRLNQQLLAKKLDDERTMYIANWQTFFLLIGQAEDMMKTIMPDVERAFVGAGGVMEAEWEWARRQCVARIAKDEVAKIMRGREDAIRERLRQLVFGGPLEDPPQTVHGMPRWPGDPGFVAGGLRRPRGPTYK